MKKTITKTSQQARIEEEQRKKDNSCPECGKPCLGTVMTRTTGFFKVKVQRLHAYSCFQCGCEWETGWRDAE